MKKLIFAFLGLFLFPCSSGNATQLFVPRVFQNTWDSHNAESDLRDIELEIHRRINAHRQNDHKLPPLQISETISQVCRTHSKNMGLGRVRFGHGGFDDRTHQVGESIKYGAAAENVGSSMG